MRRIHVIGTGGTIASRQGSDGASRATDDGAEVLRQIGALPDVEVSVEDVFTLNSFAIALPQVAELSRAVTAALADPTVTAVVITHGTDTIEESAYLLDLVHDDDRPVVLTGAQRSGDDLGADGPRNLRDAIVVAASPRARSLGVLVSFDGVVLPARGTRKTETLRPGAFTCPDAAVLGRADESGLRLSGAVPGPRPLLDVDHDRLARVRVDVAAFHPGADAVALDAFHEAGTDAVVLVGSGAGNANEAWVEAVGRLHAAGVVVGLTTRVDHGPVAAIYGAGGGVDLVAAGAVLLGTLRAPQARVLVAALLSTDGDPDSVRRRLGEHLGQHPRP